MFRPDWLAVAEGVGSACTTLRFFAGLGDASGERMGREEGAGEEEDWKGRRVWRFFFDDEGGIFVVFPRRER